MPINIAVRAASCAAIGCGMVGATLFFMSSLFIATGKSASFIIMNGANPDLNCIRYCSFEFTIPRVFTDMDLTCQDSFFSVTGLSMSRYFFAYL